MDSLINVDTSEKIKPLKMLILDVDGVMTDGKIIYDDSGSETKVFSVRDGHGIKLLTRIGMNVAIITSRTSKAVRYRAEDLGITLLFQGATDKLSAYNKLLGMEKLSSVETAYVGDDIVDIPVLSRVGFSVTVADAVEEVSKYADYITAAKGGDGAVREVCELILKAKDRWCGLMQKYER